MTPASVALAVGIIISVIAGACFIACLVVPGDLVSGIRRQKLLLFLAAALSWYVLPWILWALAKLPLPPGTTLVSKPSAPAMEKP